MNWSDSERIATVLEKSGYKPSLKMEGTDLIVVNMCSVRQSAVDRIFGLVLKFVKFKTLNRKLITILTGCVLKEDKNKFVKEFDLILDIKDLQQLPSLLKTKTSNLKSKTYLEIKPIYKSNFSASIPIMTGCNNFCSFCVVPYSRGKEISRPAKEIICEVKNLIKRGYKEIWLLGQNVNSYKSDKINFPKLLKMVNDIPGLQPTLHSINYCPLAKAGPNFWIRFTSSHPKDLSDKLIDAMAKCKKVTPYLNLPVQSGDNEILKKMNRPYTVSHYKNLVKKIRRKIPKICLSTDIIVGFPGENKKQFQNTVKLFKEIKFNMAYIAQYSPRPGTVAAKFKDDVSHREKEKRWRILNDILKKTASENNKRYIGKTVDVLVEDYRNGFLVGKSCHYKTVKIQNTKYKIQNTKLIGQFVKVKITNANPFGLKGELINHKKIKREASL